MVKANNKIQDVALHVLHECSDTQDAATHLDMSKVPEDKHSLTVMDKNNILKVLNLDAGRLSRRDFEKIPRNT